MSHPPLTPHQVLLQLRKGSDAAVLVHEQQGLQASGLPWVHVSLAAVEVVQLLLLPEYVQL